MLFRSASVAILACATSAAAKPQPYKLAVMAVPGLGLSRRDTLGYQPEETVCGEGNTCAEACGGGYTQCPSNDAAVHCFNPEAAQLCCTDGTGNSCEAGYYCTHDTQLETWCCPDAMDLAECAAAYGVTGGLETPAEPTTSSTSQEPTTSHEPTTSTTSTTPTWTPTPSWTSTPLSSSCTTSSWATSANTTVTTHVQTSTEVVTPPADTTAPESSEPTGAASASGVSLALLVAAAGFVTLF